MLFKKGLWLLAPNSLHGNQVCKFMELWSCLPLLHGLEITNTKQIRQQPALQQNSKNSI